MPSGSRAQAVRLCYKHTAQDHCRISHQEETQGAHLAYSPAPKQDRCSLCHSWQISTVLRKFFKQKPIPLLQYPYCSPPFSEKEITLSPVHQVFENLPCSQAISFLYLILMQESDALKVFLGIRFLITYTTPADSHSRIVTKARAIVTLSMHSIAGLE